MSTELKTVAVISQDNPVKGDLALVDGQFVLVDGAEGIAQHIRGRLELFRGEWFLDTREGMPYFEEVFVKNPDLDVIRSIFRKAILETPGVASVIDANVTMDSAKRTARVTFAALLDTNEIITSESFGPFIVEF